MIFRRTLLPLLLCLVGVNAMARSDGNSDPNRLTAQARVSRQTAEHTALDKVPGGVIASAELEREHGKLVWSFDIKQAGSKDITEIQVDAVSGAIVSTEIEDPRAQAKEAAADRKHSQP